MFITNAADGGRRHYPHLTNCRRLSESRPIRRRYLPHGYGEEQEFRPHSRHLEPQYTITAPDWRSSLSQMHFCAASHEKANASDSGIISGKHFNSTTFRHCLCDSQFCIFHKTCRDGSAKDVNLYVVAATTNRQDQCEEDKTLKSDIELHVLNSRRNGIPCRSPGDKCYRTSECSKDFYKLGSTYPAVNFGIKRSEDKESNFAVIEKLSSQCLKSYKELQEEREKFEERKEVKDLDSWKPASPLICPEIPQRKSAYRSKSKPSRGSSRQTPSRKSR